MASIFFSALAQALSADVVGVAAEQDRSRSVSAALGQLCAYMRLRPPPGTVLDPLAGQCIFCKSVRHASCSEKGHPFGGEPASQSDSERGSYLHLSSLIIILLRHHRHQSFLKRWVRSRAVWISSMPCLTCHHHVSLVCPHRPCALPSLGYPY